VTGGLQGCAFAKGGRKSAGGAHRQPKVILTPLLSLFCPNKFGTIYIAKPDERFATCAFSPLLQSQTHRGENTPYLICTNQRVLEKEGGEGVLQEGKSIVTLNRPIRPISPSLPGHARCCRVETVWGALHFDATVVVAAAAAAAGVQLDAGMLKIVCISFFYSICLSIL